MSSPFILKFDAAWAFVLCGLDVYVGILGRSIPIHMICCNGLCKSVASSNS